MADILIDGELVLHGEVGQSFFGDGFTSNDVVKALATMGRGSDIVVRINSGGGIATEGAAIYSALRSHRGNVDVIVEGIAASAASIIAMGGDTITMRRGSTMMIHDPSGLTFGTAKDHEKSIEALSTIANTMADVYAERSGKTIKEARADMVAETWMTADEAVAQGYADKVDGGSAIEPTAFNYRLYQRAPQQLVAMASAKGWGGPFNENSEPAPAGRKRRSASAKPRPMEIPNMTESNKPADAPETLAAAATETTTPAKPADVIAQPVETSEQIAAKATKAERDRTADITAACNMAGKPEKASEFITAGKSVSETLAALAKLRAETKTDEVDPKHRVAEPEIGRAWEKATAKVNARMAAE